ncbi:MAG: hypothetical protein J0H87_05835 [Holosporales bacterium]|nr:hypothetical protein [Holosporales bacterium]
MRAEIYGVKGIIILALGIFPSLVLLLFFFHLREGGDPGRPEKDRMVIGKIFRSLEILGTRPRMTKFERLGSHG